MELPKFYDAEVIRNEKISENAFLLEVKLPEDAVFSFKAGQYALIYLTVEEKEVNRAFSICSKPSQKTVEFLIRRIENGLVSPRLSELKVGDKLKVRSPFGMFTVKNPEKETVFIAAGTGIAPFRSMIHEVLESLPDQKISLIFGFKTEREFFFKEEFEKLEEKHKNFTVHPCCTEGSNYKKGRVTDFLKEIIDSTENKDVYICGPNQMINDSLGILIKEMNFKKGQTHIERWGHNL